MNALLTWLWVLLALRYGQASGPSLAVAPATWGIPILEPHHRTSEWELHEPEVGVGGGRGWGGWGGVDEATRWLHSPGSLRTTHLVERR